MRLKSRTQACPNGFLFEQKETGWKNWVNAPETVWDFNGLCAKLRQHRMANPQFGLSTNIGVIANEVDQRNAQRMMTIPGASIYVEETPTPKPEALPHISQKLLDAVEGAKKTARGISLIFEWLKEGVAVDYELAIARATTCTQCPMNNTNESAWGYFTKQASARILEMIASRADLNLATPLDDKLGICDACLCPMKTKIWVPMDQIRAKQHPEITATLWEKCWMRRE